jgi:sulfate permease, SulP family
VAVLVPEALAYASIAGVSPVVGLYAAPPALLLYAAFGSSRHLVVGPMSATAALSAAAVADLTTGGPGDVLAFTAVLALVTGVLAIRRAQVGDLVSTRLHDDNVGVNSLLPLARVFSEG